MLKVKVIIGSTREGRFADKPAQWIFKELKKRGEVEAEILDLRDYEMPFFNEPVNPSAVTEPYQNEAVKKWTDKIAEADGFVIVTPEYNHSFPAVLKNAIDWVYREWNKKAVAFVSYGSALGARSIEQLRLVVNEAQMAPVRSAVLIPSDVYQAAKEKKAEDAVEVFGSIQDKANTMIDQLIWWTEALKIARENS